MRVVNSFGKVNRVIGVNELEGCVLVCNRGLVGSYVENWVDLNWNKMIKKNYIVWLEKRVWLGW